jgi:hypothetical protein
LEHVKPALQGGKAEIQQLAQQHGDEVGPLVDGWAAGVSGMLVGGEGVDEVWDAFEQEDGSWLRNSW